MDESAVQPPVHHPLGRLQRGLGTVRNSRGDERYIPLHCNTNPSYVFPEKELRGQGTNFHIYVSVSDVYIPSIGLHVFLQQNRQTDRRTI